MPHEAPVSDADAAALASAFAADMMSWSEDDPQRRAAVLARYRPDLTLGTLGWNGVGRQRAEIVIVGSCRRTTDANVAVDLRIRVVPYRRIAAFRPAPPPTHTVVCPGAIPAAAPPPTALGWEALDSEWVRLSVPVTRNRDGHIAIDFSASPSATRTRTT
ncbi:hypothetical protein [Pseudonocardia sp. TRM90224]|uniref:hypothetical protein n=1 Tax=Pseudonocardia sp. TRM90224 TaxID=2812678 RepID=UPI001E61D428|nr:hypothetical protein [Pseudonocardia sp. TRM90224]